MALPTDRRYAETHEWHKPEGNLVVIGLTPFAVDQLTDITFVEMKGAGTKFETGGEIGEVESVKTSSGIYAGVGGEVVEVNGSLGDDPSLLNSDPLGKGWLVKIRPSDAKAIDKLLDAKAYEAKNPG